jgi:trehalose 6-phosphate phosphatase
MLPDSLPPAHTAFFLDFDGTLAEIVPDPDRASVEPGTLACLIKLEAMSRGALAVVSGRSIDQLDRMLRPLRLPLAGVHGLERRDALGGLSRATVDARAEQRLTAAVRTFVGARPGLLAELKPGSISLHYRKRPELEPDCLAFAIDRARNDRQIRLIAGKQVVEMTLAGRTKGDAIADFMEEEPFRGRLPFFAGDDTTDEAGFALVNAMGGVSLKVGPGETCAHYRLEDPGSFAAYLEGLAH